MEKDRLDIFCEKMDAFDAAVRKSAGVGNLEMIPTVYRFCNYLCRRLYMDAVQEITPYGIVQLFMTYAKANEQTAEQRDEVTQVFKYFLYSMVLYSIAQRQRNVYVKDTFEAFWHLCTSEFEWLADIEENSWHGAMDKIATKVSVAVNPITDIMN